MTTTNIMEFKKITVNNIEIVAHSDGSISKPYYGGTRHTFVGKNNRGYMRIRIGSKTVQVHRLIARAFLPDFFDFPQVDHIDGNPTNNNVSNLRMATDQKNNQGHQNKPDGCSSQYRGVCWEKLKGRWRSQCKIDSKTKFIGFFDNEREAAVARDDYVFSQGFPPEGLNFPENYA